MQKRAGLLYLSKNTKKILLILENSKWTVPTFERSQSLLEDANNLLKKYKPGRIIPVELYLSIDKGFEYSTYICMVDDEFTLPLESTYAWSLLDQLPNQLHSGLKATLNNQIIRIKIETIVELSNADNKQS